MNSKANILERWKWQIENSNYLWKCQAQIIYNTIENNTIEKAIEILKEDYKKYSRMACSGFTKIAIDKLEELQMEPIPP